jgi:hypothetical protein
MIRRSYRWLVMCLALATGISLSVSAHAQSDLIKEAKQRQEIATQKAESEVRDAIRKAKSASKSDAAALLQQALDRLQADDEINRDRKDGMIRTVKQSLQLLGVSAKVSGDSTTSSKIRDRQAERDKLAADADAIRAAMKEINRLDGAGRKEEAQRKVNDLLSQFPDDPAVKALARNTRIQTGVREGQQILKDREKADFELTKDLQRDSTPPAGDVEFDKKNWKRITEARKGVALTAKEKALLAALNEPVKADFRNVKLTEVIDYLATVSKQTIVVEKEALKDANVNYEDATVNFVSPRSVSMRTALRKILLDNGLTYVIKDELIYVTTPQKARDLMVTRVYPIGDLITGIDSFGTNGLKNLPAGVANNEVAAANMIIDMIKSSTDPDSWAPDNRAGGFGKGTITYSPLNKALIIRQSSEIQLMMKGTLGGGSK